MALIDDVTFETGAVTRVMLDNMSLTDMKAPTPKPLTLNPKP
jgi:hypothetical protein